ncbi:MAG: TSUP family transporter [Nostocoides sp.]
MPPLHAVVSSVPEVAPHVVALLLLAAFSAGWVDAVVGGGGLIQLPALLIAFPQAAPVHLLATNKLSSVMGTTTSATTFVRRVRLDWRTALPLALAAFAGSLIGAVIASHIPRSAFNPVILLALVLVATTVLARPRMGAETLLRHTGARHYGLATLAGFGIGIYDGALGPGTGSFFVFALVGLLGYGFLEASAKAKLANVATNVGSLLIFIPQGVAWWRLGAAMGLANVLGGYLGARTAVAKGSGFIRAIFLVVVTAFILRIGYDTFAQLD